MAKIPLSVNELLKKIVFKVLLVVVVVVVEFQQAYLENQIRYEDETLHSGRNP